jgi:ABC-type multidrug transport system ATPase subunit
MADPAIVAEGLGKRFGHVTAIDGVDLELAAGGVLGVLGPNGAGKTTTVRILATLLKPDRGRAWVAGFDVTSNPAAVRRLIGVSGQYAAVDPFLTGQENLVMIGRLYGLIRRQAHRRAGDLIDVLELASAAGRLVRTYSGGMRRRLDVAASLLAAPPVLLLDEPTTGLDPRGRLALWQVLSELARLPRSRHRGHARRHRLRPRGPGLRPDLPRRPADRTGAPDTRDHRAGPPVPALPHRMPRGGRAPGTRAPACTPLAR